MNKSLLTNILAIAMMGAGYHIQNDYLWYAGLFAFSGAITNWLAIHMLFEKVPGLYGSGVIPARFEEFKLAIKNLMMEQFFTEANIDRFLNKEMAGGMKINLEPVIEKVDLNPAFDSLVEVIEGSQFGGMLAMFGGAEALQPMRQPFVEKMQESISLTKAGVSSLRRWSMMLSMFCLISSIIAGDSICSFSASLMVSLLLSSII
ncbi:MAG: hypothetical protein AAGK05_18430, partial [Pseudomonadota bacterium]